MRKFIGDAYPIRIIGKAFISYQATKNTILENGCSKPECSFHFDSSLFKL